MSILAPDLGVRTRSSDDAVGSRHGGVELIIEDANGRDDLYGTFGLKLLASVTV